MNNPVILSLISGLAGSFIGGGFALLAVRHSEYFRATGIIRRGLRDIESALGAPSGHPANTLAAEIIPLELLVDDAIRHSVLRWRKRRISQAWNQLKSENNTQYTDMGTLDAKRLIVERLHALNSVL